MLHDSLPDFSWVPDSAMHLWPKYVLGEVFKLEFKDIFTNYLTYVTEVSQRSELL